MMSKRMKNALRNNDICTRSAIKMQGSGIEKLNPRIVPQKLAKCTNGLLQSIAEELGEVSTRISKLEAK